MSPADTIRASAELMKAVQDVGPFVFMGTVVFLVILMMILAIGAYIAFDTRRRWRARQANGDIPFDASALANIMKSETEERKRTNELLIQISSDQKENVVTLREIRSEIHEDNIKAGEARRGIKEDTAVIRSKMHSLV